MRNFHLPLPERTYTLLRAEAERAQLPATTLAREAIDALASRGTFPPLMLQPVNFEAVYAQSQQQQSAQH